MNVCETCGACCAHSAGWPIFTTDDDDDIALIPAALVSGDGRGMRCEGDRCAALDGAVGGRTACRIYGLRPDVCRTCQPGDGACTLARLAAGMTPLATTLLDG